jgi:hypothetical protein
MRKELQNRLAKVEATSPGGTFKTAIVRGNPEEQAAEVRRLRAAGAINCSDVFITYESAEDGKPASEIEEMPSGWIKMMLREIDEESRMGGK